MNATLALTCLATIGGTLGAVVGILCALARPRRRPGRPVTATNYARLSGGRK